MRQGFIPPKPDAASDDAKAIRQHTREIASSVRVIMQGGLNTVLDVALSSGLSTVVEDDRLTVDGVGLLDPVTLSAAADLYAGDVVILAGDRLPGNGRSRMRRGCPGACFGCWCSDE